MAVMYDVNANEFDDNEKDIRSISMINNRNYGERFYNEVMKKCGEWGTKSPENIYNFFVNGDFNGDISKSVNSMVVIGDISDKANIAANKVIHVEPFESDEILKRTLTREAQRNWRNIDEYLNGSVSEPADSSKSVLLLKTFSRCLASMKSLDDDKFKDMCDRIMTAVLE